jgi:dihydroxyacid dehydratase/phosphogluconate dehydratase
LVGDIIPLQRATSSRFGGRLRQESAVRRKVPVLCDLKPSGRYMAVDFHRVGGVQQVLRMLLDHGFCTVSA